MKEGDKVNVQLSSVAGEQGQGAKVEFVNNGMMEMLFECAFNGFAHLVFVFVPVAPLFFAYSDNAYSDLLGPFLAGSLILGLVKVLLLVSLPSCS